jgi:hypothetical protein
MSSSKSPRAGISANLFSRANSSVEKPRHQLQRLSGCRHLEVIPESVRQCFKTYKLSIVACAQERAMRVSHSK